MLNVSLSGKFSNIPFDGRKAQSGLSHYPATADAWMGFDGIVGSFNLDVGIFNGSFNGSFIGSLDEPLPPLPLKYGVSGVLNRKMMRVIQGALMNFSLGILTKI